MRPRSPGELFVVFTTLALQGFGGVLAVAQRVLCEQKRWLTREQFIEILAIGQVLPGPNVCNIALMIGDRFFGLRGAFAALGGMIAIPLVIVLLVTAAYAHFSAVPAVAGALKGMGAVSAGLIAGTGLKLIGTLRSNVLGWPACAVFAVVVFVVVAVLRWPLIWVLFGMGTLTCATAWWRLLRRARAQAQARVT